MLWTEDVSANTAVLSDYTDRSKHSVRETIQDDAHAVVL